jgi:hypothetical protein
MVDGSLRLQLENDSAVFRQLLELNRLRQSHIPMVALRAIAAARDALVAAEATVRT